MVDTEDTRLGRMASKQAAAHSGLSGAYPLSRGKDAFLARLALAETAERSLDVQYYIWRNDMHGHACCWTICVRAARAGRAGAAIDRRPRHGAERRAPAADRRAPNIEVRLFNPIASAAPGCSARWSTSGA